MRRQAIITLLATSMTGCILKLPAPEPEKAAPEHYAATNSQPVAPAPAPQPQSASDWVDVGTAMDMTYQIKRGSFRFDKDTSGNSLAILMGRQIDLKTQDVYFVQWTVTGHDCGVEHGSIYAYGMDGKMLWRNDFVFSGGTIAATIAEAICLLAIDAVEAAPAQQPTKKKPKPQGQSI